MKLGKRRKDVEPGGESVSVVVADTVPERAPASPAAPDPPRDEPVADVQPPEPEPAVDGVAVELPAEPFPSEPAIARPVAPAMRESAAPPLASAPGPSSVGGAASAAGSPTFDGHAPDPVRQPLEELVAERPELLVGAAFAGGILAAMILRRLGN
jgi:hypothetical protein